MQIYLNKRLEDKFTSFVSKIDSSGAPACWLWKGNIGKNGYGYFKYGTDVMGTRQHVLAHRFSYNMFRGEIKKTLTIDHLCRVRSCVNPTHLRVVTIQENVSESYWVGNFKRGVFCKKGHPLIGKTVKTKKNGIRYCTICAKEYAKKRYLRASK